MYSVFEYLNLPPSQQHTGLIPFIYIFTISVVAAVVFGVQIT